MFTDEHLKLVHKRCSHHREAVLSSELCGCFSCGQRIRPVRFLSWTDNKQTAFCPYCGIDAVLPDNDPAFVLNAELLEAMRVRWFNYP